MFKMESSDTLWLILSVLFGSYVILYGFLRRVSEWYYVSRLGKKQYSLPPGDMGWPVIGNMLSFHRAFSSGDPDSFISSFVTRFGHTGIYRAFMFGSPCIIVCAPETCRQVFTDEEHFTLGYPKSTKLLTGRRSFHSISNAEHKRLRRLTTPPISGNAALSMYIEHVEDIVKFSLDEWSIMTRPIEFLTETRKVAFKVITHIFLGSDADGIFEKLEMFYRDLTHGLKSPAINLPGFTFHKALKARQKLVRVLQGALDEKKAMKESNKQKEKKAMVDLLMEIEDEDGRKLDDEDIIDLLLMFLLAGHESTAHGTMWATLFLQENPEIFQKAKGEQEEIMRCRPSTQKGLSLMEIKQMEYLAKVIDEMLRRASISFANFREATVDVDINGYIIPNGWKVLIWSRAVHMDPENYTNPKQFSPSRWDNHKAKAGAFIPFGGGSRICPGNELAKLEISIFLHHFLLGYKLERINPECPQIHIPLSRPKDNCLAKIIKI